jgi:hypothetical protein
MRKNSILILIFLILTASSELFGSIILTRRDTIAENQTLYNGKIWRNLYNLVQGDQFLFSKDFLPGSLTIKGKTFNDV